MAARLRLLPGEGVTRTRDDTNDTRIGKETAMTATTKPKRRRKLPDSYFALVREFPLTSIEDEAHLDEAVAVMDRLLRRPLDRGEEKYLDALSDLIEVYEDEHHALPDAPPSDVLGELMSGHGLTQAALAEKAGIAQSTLSAVLAGKRDLTVPQMQTLGRVFAVDPSVFLPGLTARGRLSE